MSALKVCVCDPWRQELGLWWKVEKNGAGRPIGRQPLGV